MDFCPLGAKPIEGPFKNYEEAVNNVIYGWSNNATLLSWDVEAETAFN
jgi:hypothetical protein